MKKFTRSIKNKGLINTFKKASFKNFFQKKKFKKQTYFLISFKKIINFFERKKKFFKFFLKKKQKINYTTHTNSFLKITTLLLKYMFIKIYKPITNTLRFKKKLYFVKYRKILKNFKFFSKNNAGRNNSGGVTIFSKGLKNKQISLITNSTFWNKSISCAISIIENKKKMFLLQKHTTGSLSIIPYISGVFIGQKLYTSILPQKFWNNNLPGNCVMLKFLDKYNIFSNLFVKKFKKYAVSCGTFCQLIDYFSEFNLSYIVLPSKKTMYVSGFSFVFLGSNSLQQKKYCVLGKAGINKIYGIKSKVRGVARNPVDHPHGGRTKTNQPEVSIWGWIAKKNK